MKKLKTVGLLGMATIICCLQTSCIGSFKLTKAVHEWNQNVGSKFVNELVFLVCIIVPVYEIATFIDGVVLNSIEFWTGTNPMAMKQGEKEIKIVEQNGVKYEITATQNRFDFVQLQGSAKGTKGALVYNPETQTWSYEGNNQSIKLVELTNENTANVFLPNGQTVSVEANQNGIATLQSIVDSNNLVDAK